MIGIKLEWLPIHGLHEPKRIKTSLCTVNNVRMYEIDKFKSST